MQLSAPKGSKCFCGKRAKSTMMSRDGERALLPVCMTCGLVAMQIMQALDADADSAGLELTPELQRWFATDSGLSSLTIASVLAPALKRAATARLGSFGPCVPADPDDFGRCHRLLALIPGGAARIGEVAAAHPQWAGLAAHWSELAVLYEEELPSGRAPKLYRRIQELTK